MSLTATGAAFARAYRATHDHPTIFDDFLAAALFSPDERAELERLSARAAPLLDRDAAGLAPAEALARMMRHGYVEPAGAWTPGLSLVEQLAPADIQARYFAGHSDGYRALEHTHFAAATTR